MIKSKFWPRFGPTIVTFFVALALVVIAIQSAGGEALALARIGTQFSQGDPQGSEGYDGQFVYYIARNPDPQQVAPYLDEPAYRYQRILLPLLARALSLGNEAVIPWMLVILGVLSLAGGVWAVSELFAGWGMSRWYALIYGLWAGFTLALVVDLPEPLAYGLVAGGLLAIERRKDVFGWCLLGLAVFARETTALFVAAVLLAFLAQRRWRDVFGLGLIAGLPFALFQLWLWATFGEPGVASGGANATPFEWIPFMGLLRIGKESLVYLFAMLVVFGPTVVLPSLWGIWKSVRFWLAGEKNWVVAGLLVNALVILFTPFSTFRETGGIIRFATGLMLAVLLFAGHYRQRRALNYTIFWVVLNVFLLKS